MSATITAALVATGLRLMAAHAYADGAPPGFSGGLKEETCHACHFHQPLNAPPGRVTLEGIPAQFVAGQRYALTIALTRPQMKRAGFQLSARFKADGAQAGTLASIERDRTKVESEGKVHYAGQTKAGSTVADAEAVRWTIEWTAPASGGPVVFTVAANAADGNESADGDFVYTFSAEATPPP